MADPDPYARWPVSDRLQLLAFEAELAHLPRSLIAAIWTALDRLNELDSQRIWLERLHPLVLSMTISSALRECGWTGLSQTAVHGLTGF